MTIIIVTVLVLWLYPAVIAWRWEWWDNNSNHTTDKLFALLPIVNWTLAFYAYGNRILRGREYGKLQEEKRLIALNNDLTRLCWK